MQTALAGAPPMTTPFPDNNPVGDALKEIAKVISVRGALAGEAADLLRLVRQLRHARQPARRSAFACCRRSRRRSARSTRRPKSSASPIRSRRSRCPSSRARSTPTATAPTMRGAASSSSMGGSVLGQRLYGTPAASGGIFPDQTLDGPDCLSRGQMIPATSCDQYSATLARWLGVSDCDHRDDLSVPRELRPRSRFHGLKSPRRRRESAPPKLSVLGQAHALVDAPACEEDIARGDTAAVHEISEGRYSCTRSKLSFRLIAAALLTATTAVAFRRGERSRREEGAEREATDRQRDERRAGRRREGRDDRHDGRQGHAHAAQGHERVHVHAGQSGDAGPRSDVRGQECDGMGRRVGRAQAAAERARSASCTCSRAARTRATPIRTRPSPTPAITGSRPGRTSWSSAAMRRSTIRIRRTPDPDTTQPYVMWAGTPYQHLMAPSSLTLRLSPLPPRGRGLG